MIIYKTINLVNGLKYIGKDKNNNPNYIGSGTLLKKAIKEFGKDNFNKQILEYCRDIDNLIEREIYWLEFYNAASNPEFYNLTNKAFGNSGLSEETKQKISKSLTGSKRTEETKLKMSLSHIGKKHKSHPKGINSKVFGIPKSEDCKEKMSISAKNWIRTQEWKDSIKNNRENCILSKVKIVLQYDLEGNFIKEYKSVKEARNQTKVSGVPHCAGGFIEKAGGYIWKYKE